MCEDSSKFQEGSDREPTIDEICHDTRAKLKCLEKKLRFASTHTTFSQEQAYRGQHAEMKAQIMLAIRHIEDARMRCGKVIQFSGDGVSIYDKASKA